MTVNITGPLFDEGGNALANVTCVAVAIDGVIGQDGGARVQRGIEFTSDGSGDVSVDLKPGAYAIYYNPTQNDATSLTVQRVSTWTVLTGETSMTVQEAEDTDVGTITPSILQQAEQAAQEALNSAAKAEEWAEKAEDVEVETGKYSAKHWAAKAAAIDPEDYATAAQGAKADTALQPGDYGVGEYAPLVTDAGISDMNDLTTPGP